MRATSASVVNVRLKVPEALHHKARVRAAREKITIRQFYLDAAAKQLQLHKSNGR